jgi:SAM-dependent methyltransferase
MAYYDRIAKKWHEITGHYGGALKRILLNQIILGKLPPLSGSTVLELGAGNGYFMPLVLRRFSGQVPKRIVITDQSVRLLEIARRHFRIDGADYLQMDVRNSFPFEDGLFDVVLATMLFNELSKAALKRCLTECHRVLCEDGCLIATVLHPAFVESLSRRGQLRRNVRGMLTMPGAKGLRLPVVERSKDEYESILESAGFDWESEDVHLTPEVLNEKPGMRAAANRPVAIIHICRKRGPHAVSF